MVRGSIIRRTLAILCLLFGVSQLRAQLAATLDVEVRQDGSTYIYDYTLSNSPLSSLPVNGLFLDLVNGRDVVRGELTDANGDGVVDTTDNRIGQLSLASPAGWVGEYLPYEVVFNADFTKIVDVQVDASGLPIFNNTEEVTFLSGDGFTCSDESADILPGSQLSFTLESEYGPGEQSYTAFKIDGTCAEFPGLVTNTVLAPSVPPDPPELACDFDGDGNCDLDDINGLSLAIVAGDNDARFDLNGDELLTQADIEAFLADEHVRRGNGDSDFNGTVEFADFLALANYFGLSAGDPSLPDGELTWSNGDFLVNGKVEFADFLIVADNFGMTFEDVAAASVPEPSGLWMISIALLLACGTRHCR